jgi:CubicO group peptidase (beta-lactamase class C family)
MKVQRWLAVPAVLMAAFLLGCGEDSTKPKPPPDSHITSTLKQIRYRRNLPSLAAAVVSGDSILEVGAVGIRRQGNAAQVTLDDHYHLGSNIKAMTAMLIAMEVEAGRLLWTTTLAQALPDLAGSMHAGYHDVTIAQLLKHRGGVPPYTKLADVLSVPEFSGTLTEQRAAFASWLLAQPPAAPAGEYSYSNAGYAVAGAIVERSAASPFEALLTERLLERAGITAGFGWPAAARAPQPWGHYDSGLGVLLPHDPDGPEQFPGVFTPAGDVHMSVVDYAKFAQIHLQGLAGTDTILAADTYRQLHRPEGDYALGWSVVPFDGTIVSTHGGSAGTFVSFIVLFPDRDRGLVVLTNAASEDAMIAMEEVMLELLEIEPESPGAGRRTEGPQGLLGADGATTARPTLPARLPFAQ